MSDQYLRKVGLYLSGSSGSALDLSQFEIIFEVSQADSTTPNVAKIRVLNLADATIQSAKKEFQTVRLQAGYQSGNYGTIFSGDIAQFRSGRIDNKDTFLDILAGDGDKAFQFALVNKTLAAGASQQDRMNAVAQSFQQYGVQYDSQGNPINATGGVLPRGKVLFGLAKDQMDTVSSTANVSWSIQNGQVVVIPETGYLSGEAVVLTAQTGLIGVPEATEAGVEVECLLNPQIKIGTRVQIDNASINQTQINKQGFPSYTDISFVANTSADGFYRVLVAEHRGDVRGSQWTTHLICLAVNQSSPQADSVLPTGVPSGSD